LLQGICDRKIEALEALYDRYHRRGFGLAYRITSSPETAEDVLQDAFLAIWQRPNNYSKTTGAVRPWLFTIIHHRAIDYMRRQASKPTSELEDALELPSGGDVFADAYASISRERIVEALDVLPSEQRQALELVYFGGMTFVEVGQKLDVPVGTLKSRVRLALARLRIALGTAVEL
jgi:RNA polymerase sigma factor (sigma-70 family)